MLKCIVIETQGWTVLWSTWMIIVIWNLGGIVASVVIVVIVSVITTTMMMSLLAALSFLGGHHLELYFLVSLCHYLH